MPKIADERRSLPMPAPFTLLSLSGADLTPPPLHEAALVIVDMQNEYLSGPLTLPGAAPAVSAGASLLAAARAAGAPVIHIAHKGGAGGPFDRGAHRGAIIDAMAPEGDETVIEKSLPNAFAGTELDAVLTATGRKKLIVIGFMTHMCVSSTVRDALDHGYFCTVEASACATRDLPDGMGGTVPAADLQRAALAGLSDRFAVIARGHDWR
jgi:nicotinamidase-related amidase